jgi:hypothetical protein
LTVHTRPFPELFRQITPWHTGVGNAEYPVKIQQERAEENGLRPL